MVQFQHVSKIYDSSVPAVYDLNFEIKEGEFVFLIGPSGSGKTTIIKMLIRDEVPSNGKVFFNDIDLTRVSRSKVYKVRREIGVIFQDFKLVPEKTAYENVAFAMEAAGKKNKEIKETVPYVLDIVGLANRMDAFPRQLSGGEQQRVAIARAIANNPKILIADEPTGNLDPASAWDIVQVLTKINNWGTTVIMSTHGTDIVNSLNKRVIQMEHGRIVRDDSKGGYELNKYEESLENASDKAIVADEEEKPKKSSSFKVKLNSKKSEVETESKSLLSKLKKKEQKVESKGNIRDIIGKKEDIKNVELTLERPLQLDHKPETEDLVDEVDTVQEEKPKELHLKIKPKKKSEEKKQSKNNSEKNDEVKIEDLQDLISDESETPIINLNLSEDILTHLEESGYETIEQIVKDGPDGLLNNVELEPEEIVLIAKEIKRYLDKNAKSE
jgi:cell division transport system ATP-binding protein